MSRTVDNDGDSGVSTKSIYNMTTTPLGSGATYTGSYERNAFPDVGVSCQTDNEGTLFFDFSNDGVVTNTFPVQGFAIAAGIHEFHTAVKLGRFFRARLVNNTGAQTYLRLYTYYGTFRQGNLPVGSTINDDSDCIIVREPYNALDIARSNVQSVSPFSKFGENPSVGTTNIPITTSGFYRTPTAATALELVSTDAADTLAGAGAQIVRVIGLDANWAEVQEDVSMNGITAVALATSFLRVYRIFVLQSGAYATATIGSHVGTLTLQETGGGNVWAVIPIVNSLAVGQSQIACFTVPTGKQFYIETLELSASTSKTATILIMQRDNSDDVLTPFTGTYRLVRFYDKIDGTISIPLRGLAVIPPRADLIVIGYTNTGTAAVSASFNGYLIDV